MFRKMNIGPDVAFNPQFLKDDPVHFWGMFQYLIRKMKTRLYRQKLLDDHVQLSAQYKLIKTTSQFALKMLIDQLKLNNHFIITTSPFCSLYIKSVAIQPSRYWEVHGSLNFFQCEHGLVYHNCKIPISYCNLFHSW